MFEKFQRRFPEDPLRKQDASAETVADPELRRFFELFGGRSFGEGIYRTIHPADGSKWKERIHGAFPEYDPRATCFGFDWLGRAFALDAKRSHEGKPAVLMLEPGTGEVFEIPSNLWSFHDYQLVENTDAALADAFYEAWRAERGLAPGYNECIGYRVPLFLGGDDNVPNLEPCDIDVYWHLMGQLIVQTRDLQPGTRINIQIE